MKNRDVAADYKAAMIEEHDAYVRLGDKVRAAGVAKVLKEQHDYDVHKADKPAEPPVERAVPDKDETETPEKAEEPARRGPGRPRKNPAE